MTKLLSAEYIDLFGDIKTAVHSHEVILWCRKNMPIFSADSRLVSMRGEAKFLHSEYMGMFLWHHKGSKLTYAAIVSAWEGEAKLL